MTITLATTIPAVDIKAGDMIDGAAVVSKRTLDVNVEIVTDAGLGSGKTRRIRKDATVEVVRTVPTWQDEIDKAGHMLDSAVDDVRRHVADAEANATAQRWAAKLNENVSAHNLIYRLSWDTLTMATELHVEKRMQALGHRLADADTDAAARVVASFVDELRDELVRWSPGRSTSPSSNLVTDAERDAIQSIVTGLPGRGLQSVLFAARYVERLTAAAPADLGQPFDRNAFLLMEDAS